MKLQPDQSPQQSVQALSDGHLRSSHGHVAHGGVIMDSNGLFLSIDAANWGEEMISQLQQLPLEDLEVLLIGSGPHQRFLKPSWRMAINAPKLGMETMNTPAACRTFNVLSQEGRKVGLWAIL